VKKLEQETKKKSPLTNKRGTRSIRYEDDRAGMRAVTDATDDKPVRKLRGYAILFDVLGRPWRGSDWQEKVSKSALDGVDLSNLVMLWDHNSAWVLGRAGVNLRTEIDATGLFVEVTLGNNWFDDYVYDRVERGIVDGMSFYFDKDADIATDWTNRIDVITKINEIYEVSSLAFPAYGETIIIPAEKEQQEPEDNDLVNALSVLIDQL
jgi:HK97 family phage prohead protease